MADEQEKNALPGGSEGPSPQSSAKRRNDNDIESHPSKIKKHTSTSAPVIQFAKDKIPVQESPFYQETKMLLVAPSAKGFITLIEDHVLIWSSQISQLRFDKAVVTSVLCNEFREVAEAYLIPEIKAKYPHYPETTMLQVRDLPVAIAAALGGMTYSDTSVDSPDIVLDVTTFLAYFDKAQALAGIPKATLEQRWSILTVLREKVSTSANTWCLPFSSGTTSYLTSGTYTDISGNIFVVNKTKSSPRFELLAGRLDCRKFDKEKGCYYARATPTETSAQPALLTWVTSSIPWTRERYWMDFFAPLNMGHKLYSN